MSNFTETNIKLDELIVKFFKDEGVTSLEECFSHISNIYKYYQVYFEMSVVEGIRNRQQQALVQAVAEQAEQDQVETPEG